MKAAKQKPPTSLSFHTVLEPVLTTVGLRVNKAWGSNCSPTTAARLCRYNPNDSNLLKPTGPAPHEPYFFKLNFDVEVIVLLSLVRGRPPGLQLGWKVVMSCQKQLLTLLFCGHRGRLTRLRFLEEKGVNTGFRRGGFGAEGKFNVLAGVRSSFNPRALGLWSQLRPGKQQRDVFKHHRGAREPENANFAGRLVTAFPPTAETEGRARAGRRKEEEKTSPGAVSQLRGARGWRDLWSTQRTASDGKWAGSPVAINNILRGSRLFPTN